MKVIPSVVLQHEATVETISKARQGGVMSIEVSVDELYGDDKDDDWKREEWPA